MFLIFLEPEEMNRPWETKEKGTKSGEDWFEEEGLGDWDLQKLFGLSDEEWNE